jgi:hypothetical protein
MLYQSGPGSCQLVNSRRCNLRVACRPVTQPRKGLTIPLIRPRQGRDDLVGFRVRRFSPTATYGARSLGRRVPRAADVTPILMPCQES